MPRHLLTLRGVAASRQKPAREASLVVASLDGSLRDNRIDRRAGDIAEGISLSHFSSFNSLRSLGPCIPFDAFFGLRQQPRDVGYHGEQRKCHHAEFKLTCLLFFCR